MRNARGSWWWKWDLHVHTPASLVQNYGGDSDEAWEHFLSDLEALPADFRVLGINDYLFLDGYRRILDEKSRGRLPAIELLLPVIELRIDKFCGTTRQLQKVNLHVIFSDTIPPDVIQQQFLNALQSKYHLVHSPPGTQQPWAGVPTREALTDLGEQIIASVPTSQRRNFGSPLFEGFSNLALRQEQVYDLLKSSYFRDKTLTAVGKTEWWNVRWNDNSIADKKDIINRADLVFLAGASIESCSRAQSALRAAGVNSRLLDCSDAHDFADSTQHNRIGRCWTWVKADTEFEGLRQAALEYDDRVFLGARPPLIERLENNPTRFLTSITINRTSASSFSEPWFDRTSLQLNPGLVAIIGNKGSGKSALLDILGLLGDSSRQEDASFLSDRRFKDPNDNKAVHFESQATWADGSVVRRCLNDDVEETAVERLTYVPQQLFETICNELQRGEGGQFTDELKRVIFSHVDPAERRSFRSLDELLGTRMSEIETLLSDDRHQLGDVNQYIANLESFSSLQNRQRINAELAAKRVELAAHDRLRPATITEPTAEPTEEARAFAQQFETIRLELEDTRRIIDESKTRLFRLTADLNTIAQLDLELTRQDLLLSRFRISIVPKLQALGISYEDVFTYSVNKTPLLVARTSLERDFEHLSVRLGEPSEPAPEENELDWFEDNDADDLDSAPSDDSPTSAADSATPTEHAEETLLQREERLEKELASARDRLDAPREEYEAYRASLSEWEQRRARILGSEDSSESILGLERLLTQIDDSPASLVEAQRERRVVSLRIHARLRKIAHLYQVTFAPVEQFIAENRTIFETGGDLRLDVTISPSRFEERFFEYVNRQRAGSFCGVQDSHDRLETLLSQHDFRDDESSVEFVETLLDNLSRDHRFDQRPQMAIANQLRPSHSLEELYDFLFGFPFLEARFGLKLGDREIHQLSPGEKGALLFMFYLLVDKNDTPLLLDQPEENLDNQTIYKLLIQAMKRARSRRQVFLVTHNPNLAVVSDADQIICSAREISGEPTIQYESGAIENPVINRRIMDVLEGTRPAFENRERKYQRGARLPGT